MCGFCFAQRLRAWGLGLAESPFPYSPPILGGLGGAGCTAQPPSQSPPTMGGEVGSKQPPHPGPFPTAPPSWGGWGGAGCTAQPPSQSPPTMGGEVGSEQPPTMGGEAGSEQPPIVDLFLQPPHPGGVGGVRDAQRNPPLNLPPRWGERPDPNSPHDGGRGRIRTAPHPGPFLTTPPSWGGWGGSARSRECWTESVPPPLPPQDGGFGRGAAQGLRFRNRPPMQGGRRAARRGGRGRGLSCARCSAPTPPAPPA